MPRHLTSTCLAVWVFDSSSSATQYETLLHPDGVLTCNCPGWIIHGKKKGDAGCKHTKDVAARLGSDRTLHNAMRCGGLDRQALQTSRSGHNFATATATATAPARARAVTFQDE